jgi:hypothetical protein
MLAEIVTSAMLQGVLNEITSLLPVIIPALISFIAIRKGISFLIGTLRGA